MELEVISNNLSNLQTPGFHEMNVSFSSELNSNRPENEILAKAQANIKSGKTYYNINSGGASRTDNPTDFAIQGDGYFVINTANGNRYTRNGSFSVNKDRQLVTAQGDAVLGESWPITLTSNGQIQVNKDGDVLDQDGQVIDRIRVRDFQDPQQLVPEGASYFSDPTGLFKEDSKFSIMQGHLENSNVSLVENITRIIQVSRAYESIQKSLKQQVEASKMLNQLPKIS